MYSFFVSFFKDNLMLYTKTFLIAMFLSIFRFFMLLSTRKRNTYTVSLVYVFIQTFSLELFVALYLFYFISRILYFSGASTRGKRSKNGDEMRHLSARCLTRSNMVPLTLVNICPTSTKNHLLRVWLAERYIYNLLNKPSFSTYC